MNIPPPQWNETNYLKLHSDVQQQVEMGNFKSGYDHYLKAGKHEGRRGGFKKTSLQDIEGAVANGNFFSMFRRDDIVEAYSDEPRVLPYTFEELIDLGCLPKLKKVPPLAFVQIPKTAGNSYVKLLRHNFERRMSINHESIFLHSSPEQFIYEITNGVSNYFVNGHFKLSNIFFKFVPEKYLCVTVLRDPMERFMSNFFFQTQNPFTPYHASINNGEMDFLDFLSAQRRDYFGLQYAYFNTSDDLITDSVETCLKNLQTQVSFFGLTHRFDEFLILNRLLLGVSEIFYDATQNVTKKLYKTTKTTPTNLTINDQMLKQAKDLIQDEIWFFEQAQLIYDTRASSNNNFDVLVKQYNNTKTAMKENLKSFEHYVAQSHDWTKFYR